MVGFRIGDTMFEHLESGRQYVVADFVKMVEPSEEDALLLIELGTEQQYILPVNKIDPDFWSWK